MIDATSSMAGEIAGVRAGFSSFVAGLNSATVDARFAVVVFGGAAELTLDFTSSAMDTETALNNIVIGGPTSTQNNHNLNPEAGLEAIRMVLGAAPTSDLDHNHISSPDGILNFRSDARKNLILVTDEDFGHSVPHQQPIRQPSDDRRGRFQPALERRSQRELGFVAR